MPCALLRLLLIALLFGPSSCRLRAPSSSVLHGLIPAPPFSATARPAPNSAPATRSSSAAAPTTCCSLKTPTLANGVRWPRNFIGPSVHATPDRHERRDPERQSGARRIARRHCGPVWRRY